MTQQIATQIAELLNERNQLATTYTAQKILSEKENYVYLENSGKVIACAESKKVQWYQWEISHVSVAEDYEGQGLGKQILNDAEVKAKNGNARILQCTIRKNNENSIRLFSRNGYKRVNKFFNQRTGNWVYIYQKVLSQHPRRRKRVFSVR